MTNPFSASPLWKTSAKKTAETELKESEEKFRTLTESANDAIISINSKGLIIFFNPAAEKIFGYSQTEALGKPFTERPSSPSDHF